MNLCCNRSSSFRLSSAPSYRRGGEDSFGARHRLQLFFVFRVENHFAQRFFNLVRQLAHGFAWRSAVGFECYRFDVDWISEIE